MTSVLSFPKANKKVYFNPLVNGRINLSSTHLVSALISIIIMYILTESETVDDDGKPLGDRNGETASHSKGKREFIKKVTTNTDEGEHLGLVIKRLLVQIPLFV